MKLLHLKINQIDHRPLLKGVDLYFEDSSEDHEIRTNCFIGINGSGKSQLLETIAEIFLYIDSHYRTTNKPPTPQITILFEIEYTIWLAEKLYRVIITQDSKKNKIPIVRVIDSKHQDVEFTDNEIEKYLPNKIVGYTSGENETMSIPFQTYYDSYADYVANKAINNLDLEDYEPRFYFMDYSTNLGIAISNLIFENVSNLEKLTTELNIKGLKSFQIVLQTNQTAAPKVTSVTNETGIVLTNDLKEWREFLKRTATCYEYHEKESKYIFDFLNTETTREAIKHFFKTPYGFYTVLYKFELLNNLIVDRTTRKTIQKLRNERKLSSKMPTVPDKDKVLRYSELKLELENDQIVDYLSLSDGEHQFFNIFGTLLMMNQNNSLFLLDEPETHFNPKWRRLFVSKLKEVTPERKQDIFITSHSPFIVSDSKKESVYIFDRVSKDQLEISYPKQETFGSSFNHILKMAFGMEETISEEGLSFIEELLQSNSITDIEKGINEIGESPKLLALYRRLELLKKKN